MILLRKSSITLINKILGTLIAVQLIFSLTIAFPRTSLQIGHHLDHQFKAAANVGRSTTSNLTYKANIAAPPKLQANHTHHVFFNIFLNPESRIAFFRSLKIVDEQLQQLENGTNIYFSLIGKRRFYHIKGRNICHKYPALQCTLLGDHRGGGEELTLQALYEFCLHHPEDKVSYIHDKGSFRHTSANIKNRRRATLGAVADDCLQIPLSEDYPCNMCGAKFFPMPHFGYQANMWTAECSYIRRLLPPLEYESKRRALLERLWHEHEECLSRQPDPSMAYSPWAWNLTDSLFLRNVGLGRYALERWALEHPSMIPCDLLPQNTTLRSLDEEPTLYLKLGQPIEWGKRVSEKEKARHSWLLQQQYAGLYPEYSLNKILAMDQLDPTPRPCW
jgi:hypothetical protein